MNVVVCVESPSPGRASRQALALAVGIGHPVIVLCAGHEGPPAVDLARVQRAVFVKGAALQGADHLTRGLVLAEAARHLKADLILAGTASDDEGRGLVPAALAHHLRIPILAGAQQVAPTHTADEFAITLCAGDRRLQLGCKGPLVVTVAPAGEDTPASPEASPLPWEALSLPELGLDESRLLRRPDLLGELEPIVPKPEVLSVSDLVARWLRD